MANERNGLGNIGKLSIQTYADLQLGIIKCTEREGGMPTSTAGRRSGGQVEY